MTDIVVYWLVMFAAFSGTSQIVLPVPFSEKEACEVAGKEYYDKINGWYSAAYVCVPMPKEDVE